MSDQAHRYSEHHANYDHANGPSSFPPTPYAPYSQHDDVNNSETYAHSMYTDPYLRPLPSNLARADTLMPHDSMSNYNVHVNREADRGDRLEASDRYFHAPSLDSHHRSSDVYEDRRHSPHAYVVSGTDLPLKHNAAQMGYAEDEQDEAKQMRRDSTVLWTNEVESAPHYPTDEEARTGLLGKWTATSMRHLSPEDKLRMQIDRRRQGIGRQRYPIVTWIVAVALVVVFIVELVKAKAETGQAVQTRPSINPMLGPSAEFLISFGARFVPCMRSVPALPATEQLPCLKYSTSSSNSYTSDQLCPISQLCGLSDATKPNQSYRFVSAMFVHAGFVHLLFNLLVQLSLCAQIEKLLGSLAYTLIYFAGGIGGNLLGGNFGLIGQPALGMSGAIYTCISVELVDLCYNWKYEYRARTRLVMSLVFAVLGLALGLLPGLDNFSHIGGFCVGLLGGTLFAPAIHPTKQHRIITWVLRILALGLLIGFFAGLAANFYTSDDPTKACTWCRYLSCLPVFNSCKGDGLTTSTTTTTTTTTTNSNLWVLAFASLL